MDKNILIIGNGFDLAHKLNTDYKSFLLISSRVKSILKSGNDKGAFIDCNKNLLRDDKYIDVLSRLKILYDERKRVSNDVEKLFPEIEFKFTDDKFNQLFVNVYKNIWFDYFIAVTTANKVRGINWIDFEMEISYIIQYLDSNDLKLYEPAVDIPKGDEKFELFRNISLKDGIDYSVSMYDYINILYGHLKKITVALGLYLECFVEHENAKCIDVLNSLPSIDKVISFNYTHTFRRLYSDSTPCCFIHGEILPNDNNMVLGINEYLEGEAKNRKTDFSIFKKFVQRIRNHNSLEYKEWLRNIENNYRESIDIYNKASNKSSVSIDTCNIWIYGHSLDITDKDILEPFIKSDATRIHIFAKDVTDEGKLIANTIKLITEDCLIKKVTENPPFIDYIVLEKK